MEKKYIGIDIGGTNLKAGVVNAKGELLATEKTPLEWTNAEAFVKVLAELSIAAAKKAGVALGEIAAVGMGVPGEVDNKTGMITHTVNIPLENVPVEQVFRTYLDVPVYLDNDANCAAIGEYYAGAGKGCKDFVVVTLGTGVGAGVIVDGRMVRGFNGAGGEAGHMVIETNGVQCSCGRKGCWEQYSSATALIRMTREAMQKHPESALWDVCGGDLEQIGGRSAFLVAREKGDATAKAVCDRFISYLATGVTNMVNLFQPEVLCIGGGVSNEADEALLHPLQEIVARERFGHNKEKVTTVAKAQLGNDAGIIGAALLGIM